MIATFIIRTLHISFCLCSGLALSDVWLSECMTRRGISLHKLNRLEEAVADFSEVLRMDPSNANALYSRGSARDNLGHFHEALSDYTAALTLDSSEALSTS